MMTFYCNLCWLFWIFLLTPSWTLTECLQFLPCLWILHAVQEVLQNVRSIFDTLLSFGLVAWSFVFHFPVKETGDFNSANMRSHMLVKHNNRYKFHSFIISTDTWNYHFQNHLNALCDYHGAVEFFINTPLPIIILLSNLLLLIFQDWRWFLKKIPFFCILLRVALLLKLRWWSLSCDMF